MKPRNSTLFRSQVAFAAALSSVGLFTTFATPSAIAADRTWVGGYSNTGTWNQATQWSEGAYVNGSDVIFNNITGVSSTSTFLSASRTVKSITFNGGTPSPAFNMRLATTGSGGASANLTFISTNTGITVASTDTASHQIGQSDGSIVLQGNLLVTHNGSGTLTLNRPVTGSGFSLTKSGTGLLVLSAANTYSGDTIIDAGRLRAAVGSSSVNSEVIINNAAATLSVNIADNTQSWTCNAFTPAAAGTLEFNFGATAPSTSVSPLVVTNAADFTTATPTVSVLVNSPGLLPGTYPLMTWGSTLGTVPSIVNVSNVQAGTVPSLSLSLDGLTLNLVITSTAAAIVKDDNALPLNNGLSWVGGLAPAPTEVAKWNNIVTSANTTDLGVDTTWAGIAIENPTGLVTINGTNTLTLGAATVDIDLSAATADLNLNCPLALGAANTWNVAATHAVTLGGQVSGAFGFTKVGDGTAILSSPANSYTGNTTVTAGTLQLGSNNVIPHGAGGVAGNVTVNGTLDLNGKSDSINGLSGSGVVDNAGAATSTLSVGNNAQTSTFSGVIKNTTGTINLNKTGSGALTLSGANTFTGTTTVIAGTLKIGHASALSGTTGITLAGGTTLTPTLSAINLSAPITLGATGTTATITAPDVDGSGTTAFPVTLSGAIGGDGNVIFNGINDANGYGNINLNAASTYAGSTLINSTAGNNNAQIFVNLGIDNALPITTVVTLDGGDGTGTGRVCELDLAGKNQTLAGLTNVTGRTLRTQQVVNSSGTGITLTVNNTAPFTYAARIGGGASANNLGLTKSGAGTFTISSANTYANGTLVTDGTLLVNNTTGSGAGTGGVTVNGGTLGGNGTISGSVTVAAAGNLAPGTSAGTLTIGGGLDLSAQAAGAGTLTYELDTLAGTNDKIAVTGTLTIGVGALGFNNFVFTNLGGLEIGTYKLITSGGINPGDTLDAANLSGAIGTLIGTLQITGGDLELVVSAGSGPGTVDHFDISAIASPQTVGTPITGITLTAKDASNAIATGFTGTVTFGGTAGCAGTSGNFVLGVLTSVSVTPTVAGSNLTFSVTDGALPTAHTGSTTITTVQTQYEAWAGGAAFDRDTNNDGVTNGTAWVLGATDTAASAIALQPTFDNTDPTYFIYTYRRSDAANTATNTTIAVQYGSTLSGWTTAAAGPDIIITPTDNFYSVTPGVDKVEVKIKRTLAVGSKLFARLNVVQAP